MPSNQPADDPATTAGADLATRTVLSLGSHTAAPLSLARANVDYRRLRPGQRVLDLGCGEGHHAAAMVRRGCRVVAADIDVGAVRRAASSVPVVGAAVADAQHLPFADAAFDAVVCTETLEHVADDAAAMWEIARVLRPGGLLLASVPSHFTERLYWRLSAGYHGVPGGHVRIYTPRTLRAPLRAAGFAVTSYRYVGFLDSLFWLRIAAQDGMRRLRRWTPEEQLRVLVQALEPPPPPTGWRLRLRRAMRRSTLITVIETAGAWIFPKSLSVIARKTAASAQPAAATEVDQREMQ